MRLPLGRPLVEARAVNSVTNNGFALVFAGDSDKGYARALGVAMYSALTNLAPGLSPEICVLDNGLLESSRARLLKVAAAARRGSVIHWISIPTDSFRDVVADSRFPLTTYSRLLIAEVVPSHIRRVVYLDADVLVTRDISPLFTMDLGDSAFGAARDSAITSTIHWMSGVRDRDHGRPYFNAGVLVIDVARWRSVGIGERALQYASDGETLRWVDQDALNAVAEDWHELDPHWNVQQGRELSQRLYQEAAVVHFVGGKPWNPELKAPGTLVWVTTLLRSRWYTGREASLWLLSWLASRYWLTTKRRRWGDRLLSSRWSESVKAAVRRLP
jgi:lipopolysaccharide biosynthesis glycosyltransferase